MQKVYYTCGEILQYAGYIPYVPELRLNYAKSYFGKIHKSIIIYENGEKDEVFNYIALSRFNLYLYEGWWRDEDYEELVDTICHEFAHMLAWDHGDRHASLTKKFIKEIKKIMPDLNRAENILS